MSSQVAQTILDQLGGQRFSTMTGAKNYVGSDNSLMFMIGRNQSKANKVRVTLNADDLYDVEFFSIRGVNVTKKAERSNVFADQLRDVFTSVTGMYTSL